MERKLKYITTIVFLICFSIHCGQRSYIKSFYDQDAKVSQVKAFVQIDELDGSRTLDLELEKEFTSDKVTLRKMHLKVYLENDDEKLRDVAYIEFELPNSKLKQYKLKIEPRKTLYRTTSYQQMKVKQDIHGNIVGSVSTYASTSKSQSVSVNISDRLYKEFGLERNFTLRLYLGRKAIEFESDREHIFFVNRFVKKGKPEKLEEVDYGY